MQESNNSIWGKDRIYMGPIGYIYCVENLINGKKYIGQTTQKSPEYRWTQHKKDSKKHHPNSILAGSIKKYGENNFKYTLIDYANSREELNDKEQWYIKVYNTNERSLGYNLREGGFQGPHSLETRLKMSYQRIGKKLPPRTQEHCNNISKSLLGKKRGNFTPEHRKNISASTKGKKKSPRTPNHTQKLVDAISKKYLVQDPNGITYEVCGLNAFCKQNGLNSSNMFQVAMGARNHHKGWTAKNIGMR